MQYNINRETKRSDEFSKLLRSANFKEKFVEFLIQDWANDDFAQWCEGKIVKLNYDMCYVFEVFNNRIKKSVDLNSSCNHEEADTKIIHHICQLNRDYRVRIHCTDSDIPIIMLANMKYLKANVEVVVDMSTSKKQVFLKMNEIYQSFGDKLSRALAVCHIFTGNDYNPAFFKKGKKNRLRFYKNRQHFRTLSYRSSMYCLQDLPKNVTFSSLLKSLFVGCMAPKQKIMLIKPDMKYLKKNTKVMNQKKFPKKILKVLTPVVYLQPNKLCFSTLKEQYTLAVFGAMHI